MFSKNCGLPFTQSLFSCTRQPLPSVLVMASQIERGGIWLVPYVYKVDSCSIPVPYLQRILRCGFKVLRRISDRSRMEQVFLFRGDETSAKSV